MRRYKRPQKVEKPEVTAQEVSSVISELISKRFFSAEYKVRYYKRRVFIRWRYRMPEEIPDTVFYRKDLDLLIQSLRENEKAIRVYIKAGIRARVKAEIGRRNYEIEEAIETIKTNVLFPQVQKAIRDLVAK